LFAVSAAAFASALSLRIGSWTNRVQGAGRRQWLVQLVRYCGCGLSDAAESQKSREQFLM